MSTIWPPTRYARTTLSTPARTRYHEAGQAVIGVLNREHLAAINLSPRDDRYLGGCELIWPRPDFVEMPVREPVRTILNSRVRTLLAGELAAWRRLGSIRLEGCCNDLGEARMWAGNIAAEGVAAAAPETVDLFLQTLSADVDASLVDHWELVEAIAVQLEATPIMLHAALEAFFARYRTEIPALSAMSTGPREG